MRAIMPSPDGPVLKDMPRPSPGEDEVLVRVRANSMDRADLMMLKGASHGGHGGMGFPLGLEWAGEVVEVGAPGWQSAGPTWSSTPARRSGWSRCSRPPPATGWIY